jgi:RimJ/RimL family protein N-acetyltransferase
MSDARHYAIEETLRNGTRVTIRAVRPDDRPRIEAAFGKLDRESVYTRFFSYKSMLSPAELDRIEGMDFVREAMLVATVAGGDDEVVIGSARYVAHDGADGRRAAEVAFTVEEDYQGQGVARRLLQHLGTIAREAGVAHFEADVLPENKAMLAVFERSGWPMRKLRDSGVVHVTLDLDEGA